MYYDQQAFRKDWVSRFGDQRFCFSGEFAASLDLPGEAAVFLTEMGLPRSVPPYLYFASGKNDENGSRLAAGRLKDFLPGHPNENAIVIGTDDAGSYIVLDPTQNYAVVLLEYDDSFRPVFMNTSLWEMARCLLAYADFIKMLSRENGEEAWEDATCSEQQLADLREVLWEIDPPCVENGFWKQELDAYNNIDPDFE